MKDRISIAIDGPAGAGKSTMARAVAEDLGYVYVDTGAIYRTLGYAAAQREIDPESEEAVSVLLSGLSVVVRYDENGCQHMLLNGDDVSDQLRSSKISDFASKISALPVVRDYLLDIQRNVAYTNSVIMDGRDIGTVVLPEADVKIFLTASAEIRATRRFRELVERGHSDLQFETILHEIIERDHRDMTRPASPLKQACDAVLLDTSKLSIEESIAAIKRIIEERLYSC